MCEVQCYMIYIHVLECYVILLQTDQFCKSAFWVMYSREPGRYSWTITVLYKRPNFPLFTIEWNSTISFISLFYLLTTRYIAAPGRIQFLQYLLQYRPALNDHKSNCPRVTRHSKHWEGSFCFQAKEAFFLTGRINAKNAIREPLYQWCTVIVAIHC